MRGSRIVFITLAVLPFFLWPQSAISDNVYIKKYMEANYNPELAQGVPYPPSMKKLTLRGTWREMGEQYGRAAGDYIRIVYDANYGIYSRSNFGADYLKTALEKYADEARALSPEMVLFIEGIAVGAQEELAKARFAKEVPDFHKVMLINCFFEVALPFAWPFHSQWAPRRGSQLPSKQGAMEYRPASTSWAAMGRSTKGGVALAGGTRDTPWWPNMYQVAYVAYPADPRANVVFGNVIAGMVGASAQVNDKGLYIGNTKILDDWAPDKGIREQAIGVPSLILTAYMSFYAKDAEEAAQIMTVGTPEYRQRTGRKTLLHTMGFNQILADPTKILGVERTARRYAIRRPGDAGEKGDYLVMPNHNTLTFSYDESNVRTDEPMFKFGTSDRYRESKTRFWSWNWFIANNQGKVDVEFAINEVSKLKHIYTEDGKAVYEENGVPVWRLSLTPERWGFKDPKDLEGFPIWGSLTSVVADLTNLDVYYTQGIPSHWWGPWDHISLKRK